MSEVKRYPIKYAGECRITGYGPTVDMVLASDYDAAIARAEAAEKDADRWRKCKTMRKSWWIDAITEAGLKQGRSLDEIIDRAIATRKGVGDE